MYRPLTRAEAIKLVGLEAVETVEKLNCEPTNRVLPAPATSIEYEASILTTRLDDGLETRLSAMYYPDRSDFLASKYFPNAAEGEEIDDASYIDWRIDHYKIDTELYAPQRGRPPMHGEKMTQTAIWLPTEMIAWLKAQPGTLSDNVRRLVQAAMEK